MAPYHNWNIHLSYVYDHDTNYPMKYTLSGNTAFSFVSGDGIPFRVQDNGRTYKLTSPVEHGISAGEYITISGGTLNNSIVEVGEHFLLFLLAIPFLGLKNLCWIYQNQNYHRVPLYQLWYLVKDVLIKII